MVYLLDGLVFFKGFLDPKGFWICSLVFGGHSFCFMCLAIYFVQNIIWF